VTVTGHNTVYAFGEPTAPADSADGTGPVAAADGGIESADTSGTEPARTDDSEDGEETTAAEDTHAAPSFSP